MSIGDSGYQYSELKYLKKRARADSRSSSVPLMVFGSLTLASAPLLASDMTNWRLFYWAIAGPIGFLIIAWWYRRRLAITGIGHARGSYLLAGLLLVACAGFVIGAWVADFIAIGAVLLVLAILQRNLYLAVSAILFATLGTLERVFVFNNLLYRAANWIGLFRQNDGYFQNASAIVYGLLGLLMVAAGIVAMKIESRTISAKLK
jgi:hypothetical protein